MANSFTNATRQVDISHLTAHERYIRGIPLTDDLRAVRDGKDVQLSGETRPAPPAIDNPERALTPTERGLLRELRAHEGWPVYMRLLEKTFQFQKKGAITLSEHDPLGDPQKLANRWAYLAMYSQARADAELAMQEAVKDDRGDVKA